MSSATTFNRIARILFHPNKVSVVLLSKRSSSTILEHGLYAGKMSRTASSFIIKRKQTAVKMPPGCCLTTSSKVLSSPNDCNNGNGNGTQPPHFKDSQTSSKVKETKDHFMKHPIWSQEEVHTVEINHKVPETNLEKMAFFTVQCLRVTFDFVSGYKRGVMDENKWLIRIILLETVAAVPGMVAAMARHFNSLRKLQRDHGWIHTLLEEAENERMHLMTALELKKPGTLFRGVVLVTQGLFVNTFFIWYLISPKFCHKFVAYLEEEAVKTYTFCLECIDDGRLPMWKHLPAPPIAKRYWRLPDGSLMRDVILAIRADEAHHRVVNHMFGDLHPKEKNPLGPGEHKL